MGSCGGGPVTKQHVEGGLRSEGAGGHGERAGERQEHNRSWRVGGVKDGAWGERPIGITSGCL